MSEKCLKRGGNPLQHNINPHIQNLIYGKMKESATAMKQGDIIKADELKQEAAYILQKEQLRNVTAFTGPVNSLENSDAELAVLLDKVFNSKDSVLQNQRISSSKTTPSNEVDRLIDRVFRTK